MFLINDDIINAFTLIFDGDFGLYPEKIKKINPEEIKTAYHKKAFELHPDRARLLGKNRNEMNENFKEINVAYDRICEFIRENNFYYSLNKSVKRAKKFKTSGVKPYAGAVFAAGHRRTPGSSSKEKKEAKTGFSGAVYIPKAELLIGQYLFFRRIITWKTLIEAIIWQRSQRPLFGEIAKSWNMLTDDDIRSIISKKSASDRIGDYARANGYINGFEHLAIIGRQRSLQRPIGEYFISRGYISPETMEEMVSGLRRHNTTARSRTGFKP